MIDLYYWPTPNGHKITIFLEETGLAYAIKPVNISRGEQFAAQDAVGRLRAVRKAEKPGERIVVSAADPLNLVGIVTPEARVPAIHTNRVLMEDGLPIAALEGGEVRRLAATTLDDEQLKAAFRQPRRRLSPQLHPRTLRGREAEAMANRTLH